MTDEASQQLERMLAATLYWGTWVASSVVGAGLALALLHSRAVLGETAIRRDERTVIVGLALFIILPVIRVVVMLSAFLHERNYRFSMIAALVLTIVLLGFSQARPLRSACFKPTSLFAPPGYQVDLLYLACLAALVLGGSGPLAIDRYLKKQRPTSSRL